MRKLIVSVALATAALAAVPAAAQYQGQVRHQGNGWHQNGANRPAMNNLLRQLEQVDNRIDRSVRRGFISQREAHGLRRNASNVRGDLYRSARNGISRREFAELQQRVNRLEQRVRFERRDFDGRRG